MDAGKALEGVIKNHDVQLYLRNIRALNQPIWCSVAVVAHQAIGNMWSIASSTSDDGRVTKVAAAASESVPKLCSLVGIAGFTGLAASVASSVVTCTVMTRRLAAMERQVLASMSTEHCKLRSDFQELGMKMSGLIEGLSQDVSEIRQRIDKLPQVLDEKLLQADVLKASAAHQSVVQELRVWQKDVDRGDGNLKAYVQTLVFHYNILRHHLLDKIQQGRSASSHVMPDVLGVGTELLSIIFPMVETILLSATLLRDQPSQRARERFEELAPVVGLLYWLAIQTGDESWLSSMEPRRLSFLSLALPFMQVDDEQPEPLDKLLQRSPHASLFLDPCSIHLRASLLLQILRDESLAEDLGCAEPAWSFLNHQVSMPKTERPLQDTATVGLAGLAAYSKKPDVDLTILKRVVTLLARVANQDARALSRFIADLKPESSDLRWQDCLEQAKKQSQVPLGLVLLDSGLVSAVENWPLSAAHLEHLMGMDACAKAKFHKQLQEGDSGLVKDMLAHVHLSLQSFLELVKKIEVNKDKQPRIEEIKHRVESQWQSVQEEKDCVIIGGLVSNGKSSLVNAFISRFVPPDWWSTLVPNDGVFDAFEQRNFLQTDYSENTLVVTEIEFHLAPEFGPLPSPVQVGVWRAEEIEGEMLQFIQDEAPQRFENLAQAKEYMSRFQVPVQGHCRLQVKILLPRGSAVLKRPLVIIDTPGLDSPRVWEQLHSLVSSKAFLFLWVGDLTSATSFGKEGHQLVDLLLTQRQPVPPLLVLTKWDEIKERKEFRALQRRKEHIVRRVKDLLQGLCLSRPEKCFVLVRDRHDLDRLVQALPKQAVSPDICGVLPLLATSDGVALEVATMLGGTNLKPGDRLISPLEVLQSRELPAQLEFETRSHACRPLLAATNAQGVLATLGLEQNEQEMATAEVDELWQQIIELMTAVGEPMRRTKQLYFVRTAVQELTNVVLETDPQAVAQTEDYMEGLRRLKDEGLQNFTRLVDQYFARLPANASELAQYQPQWPLQSSDTTKRLASIIEDGLRDSEIVNLPDGKQILKVAQKTFDCWKVGFEETLRVLEAQSFTRLHSQAQGMLEDLGADAGSFHAHRVPFPQTRDSMIAFESADSGSQFYHTAGVAGLATALCGMVGGACVMATAAAFTIPFIMIGSFASAVGGIVSLDTAHTLKFSARQLLASNPSLAELPCADGYWITETEKAASITNAVLQTLASQEFQDLAKKHAIDARKTALEQCLKEFSKLRSASATNTEYAHTAVSLQAELKKYMHSLDEWLSDDLASRTGNRAWLAAPGDLRDLLTEVVESEGFGH